MSDTLDLQVINSSGDITELKIAGVTDGDKVLTSDEISALFGNKVPTTVSVVSYTLLSTDQILHVTRTATGVCGIVIPTALITTAFRLVIKDAGGLAGTNEIVIYAEGGETIDGAATATINSNYSAINLYSDGTNLFIY